MVEICEALEDGKHFGERPGSTEPGKYEKFLCNDQPIVDGKTALQLFMCLPINPTGRKIVKGSKYVLVEKGDINYTGDSIGGMQHGFNKCFAAAMLPYFAIADGKIGVKILRISEEFDVTQYAVKENTRYTSKTYYHTPGKGQSERMRQWLVENDYAIVVDDQILEEEKEK